MPILGKKTKSSLIMLAGVGAEFLFILVSVIRAQLLTVDGTAFTTAVKDYFTANWETWQTGEAIQAHLYYGEIFHFSILFFWIILFTLTVSLIDLIRFRRPGSILVVAVQVVFVILHALTPVMNVISISSFTPSHIGFMTGIVDFGKFLPALLSYLLLVCAIRLYKMIKTAAPPETEEESPPEVPPAI